MFISPFLFLKKRSTRYKRNNKFVFVMKINKNFSLRLLLTTFLFALSSFILIYFIFPYCIYFCLSAFYTVNIPLSFTFFNFLDIFYTRSIELLSSLPEPPVLLIYIFSIYSFILCTLYQNSDLSFFTFYLYFISLLCFST